MRRGQNFRIPLLEKTAGSGGGKAVVLFGNGKAYEVGTEIRRNRAVRESVREAIYCEGKVEKREIETRDMLYIVVA